MSKKFAVVSAVAGVIIILLVVFYLNWNLKVRDKESPQDQTSEVNNEEKQNEITDDSEFKSASICERKGIVDMAQIDNDSQVITRVEAANKDESAYYNDYLFCESLANGGRSGDVFNNTIEISDFSQKAYLLDKLAKLNSLNAMLKSSDCKSSDVVKAANDYKKVTLSPSNDSSPANLKNETMGNIKKNLSDIAPADLCGFFKRNNEVVEKLKSQDFCVGYAWCEAMIDDNLDACDKLASEDDKKSCRDDAWYLRAINGGNAEDCSNIGSSIKNISCQAYFLEDKKAMCKGIASEIKATFYCK